MSYNVTNSSEYCSRPPHPRAQLTADEINERVMMMARRYENGLDIWTGKASEEASHDLRKHMPYRQQRGQLGRHDAKKCPHFRGRTDR